MQIELEEVTFGYTKKVNILSDFSLKVPKGTIYGFIGPNGAGKSTVMQLITGILTSQKGQVSVFGESLQSQIPSVFNKIGALIESPALYLHLSGIDNLRCITTLKNIPENKIYEVLETVGLSENGNQKVKQYSLGMKQRLAIAMTLLGEPELLLLDEPVNGLDPSGINDIREILVNLNKEKGVTIFISSHLLSEIEKMCTHIGLIHHGKIQFEGTLEELYNKENNIKINVTSKNISNYLTILKESYDTFKMVDEDNFTVKFKDKESIPLLAKFMIKNKIPIYQLRAEDNLEDWFLLQTKK